jgi:hypothetical protein
MWDSNVGQLQDMWDSYLLDHFEHADDFRLTVITEYVGQHLPTRLWPDNC